jgi:hypothetical protein
MHTRQSQGGILNSNIYIYLFTRNVLLFHRYQCTIQIDSKEFIEDLHPIYGLYTLDDEDVIKEKPHAPYDECEVVATDLLDK